MHLQQLAVANAFPQDVPVFTGLRFYSPTEVDTPVDVCGRAWRCTLA
jgi:hypothetical protein